MAWLPGEGLRRCLNVIESRSVHFNAFQHDHGNQHEASVHGTAQVRSAKPRSGSAELTWDVVEINGTPFGSFFWGMN